MRRIRAAVSCSRHSDGRDCASPRSRGESVQDLLADVVAHEGKNEMREQPTSRRVLGAGGGPGRYGAAICVA